MNLDEQLQYIATLQRSHDEQITRLVEQGDRNKRHIHALADHMNVLTGRTIQAMDAINRLARIADSHEDRIDEPENPPS